MTGLAYRLPSTLTFAPTGKARCSILWAAAPNGDRTNARPSDAPSRMPAMLRTGNSWNFSPSTIAQARSPGTSMPLRSRVMPTLAAADGAQFGEGTTPTSRPYVGQIPTTDLLQAP